MDVFESRYVNNFVNWNQSHYYFTECYSNYIIWSLFCAALQSTNVIHVASPTALWNNVTDNYSTRELIQGFPLQLISTSSTFYLKHLHLFQISHILNPNQIIIIIHKSHNTNHHNEQETTESPKPCHIGHIVPQGYAQIIIKYLTI